MSEQLPPTTPAERDNAELSAYLDGELDAPAALLVERRLADDADYRRRFQALRQVWDWLDELPRPEPSVEFAETTIALTLAAARQEMASRRAGRGRRRLLAWLATAAAALALFAGGYGAASRFWDRGNRQLLKDLPVIENVDLYSHVEDARFLERLAEEGLFAPEETDDGY